MKINSFDKLVQARLSNEKQLEVNKSVATAIKRKRLENDYTQEDVSKGICSISYLSNIENGHFELDNYYVQEIIKRIGIDINDITNKDYVEGLKVLVKLVYLEDDTSIINLYERIICEDPKNCLSAELIYLGKHIYFKEYNLALKLINEIDFVKKDLTNYQLKIYMYFLALYEESHMRNEIAIKYLHILSKLKESDSNLFFLVEILKIRVCIYLGNYVLALDNICNIKNDVANSMNLIKITRIKLLHAEVLAFSGELEAAKKAIDVIRLCQIKQSNILENYYYVLGLIFKERGAYEEAIKIFLSACEQYYFQSMLNIIVCYYKLGDSTSMNSYVDILNEKITDDNHKFYGLIANYYEIKSRGNLYEVKNFISTQILPQFKKIKFKYYQQKVIDDLINFHRSNGRYKEINNIRERFHNGF